MTRKLLAVLALTFIFTSCSQPEDPSTSAYWVAKLENKQERAEALTQLGKIGDKTALPHVQKWFEEEGNWTPEGGCPAAGAAGARGVQQHAGHSRCSVEPENFLFTEFTRSSQTPAKPPFVAARSRELPRGLDDRRAVTGHSEAGEGARGGDGHRGLSARVQAAVGGMREGAKRASEWARRWYYRDAG